jgi:hypothetical protein
MEVLSWGKLSELELQTAANTYWSSVVYLSIMALKVEVTCDETNNLAEQRGNVLVKVYFGQVPCCLHFNLKALTHEEIQAL